MSAMRIPVAEIFAAVAKDAGVSIETLRGPAVRGDWPENWPRQRAFLLARCLRPDVTYAILGRMLGGRDAPNVHDQTQAAARRLASEAKEGQAVRRVLDRLGVAELPRLDPHAHLRARIDLKIAKVEARLAQLRAERAALDPTPKPEPVI